MDGAWHQWNVNLRFTSPAAEHTGLGLSVLELNDEHIVSILKDGTKSIPQTAAFGLVAQSRHSQ